MCRTLWLTSHVDRLTVDIIGKVALDMQLNTQRGDNPMVSALREQVHLVPNSGTLNPLAGWSPIGIYKRWRNSKIMISYLDKVLSDRLANQESNHPSSEKQPRKRTMIDLALESYKTQTMSSPTTSTKTTSLDPDFKTHAITQIRIFLFAGHDTTSSAICYALYLLQKHPSTLALIRAEHNAVLGPTTSTPQTLKKDPYIVNKLEYTTAVLKESLRLFPAASGLRTPDSNLILRNPATGEILPTIPNMLLWIPHFGLHRDARIWGSTANTFNPSRFLPCNISSLPESSYRPFERGIRNCIGQDLAMLEARLVLAMVVRKFEFKPAFDALEELARDGSKYASDPRWRKGKQDLDGEEAYPVLIGSAKPREGMPMWVGEREEGG
jgi:cytochrome P450